MKYTLLTLLFCGFSLIASAQQDPLYSQYFNNPMLINPAFAGSNERLYAGAAYRSQWSGIDGGPTTLNFNTHMTVANNRVGVGAIVVQDQLGDIRNTQYGGVFSYRIKLTHSTFSFGMQTAFTRYATDMNAVKIFNVPDQAFNQYSETKFNTGVGVLLQHERYTIGISVPQLLANTISQGGQSINVSSQNYYLYGSYVFYMNEKVKFKPSTLIRATSGSPVSADVNLNFIFNNLYTAGVFTRNVNTYGALVQMVMGNYRLGYVFELPGKSSSLNYNTHEISLALSLDVLRSHNHSVTGF